MFKEACEQLLAQAEARRREAIAAAEAEYRQVLEAVRLIRSVSEAASDRLGHGELTGAVLAAIGQIDGLFTVRDVEERIQELAPEIAERVSIASISTTLRRLVGKGIHLAEPGYGTRPARYFKNACELRSYCDGGTMSLERAPVHEPTGGGSKNERPTPC